MRLKRYAKFRRPDKHVIHTLQRATIVNRILDLAGEASGDAGVIVMNTDPGGNCLRIVVTLSPGLSLKRSVELRS